MISIFQELTAFLERLHLLELEESISDVWRREHDILWEQHVLNRSTEVRCSLICVGIACSSVLLPYIRKEVVRVEVEA